MDKDEQVVVDIKQPEFTLNSVAVTADSVEYIDEISEEV